MNAIDAPVSNLDNVKSDTEALRGIERYLAVGFDRKVEGASRSSLPNIDDRVGKGGNVHVLSLLDRGVGNARCIANQVKVAVQLRSD